MPETTRYLPSQPKVKKIEQAAEVLVDGEFGRNIQTRVFSMTVDPHKTRFPQRAGGDGIVKLVRTFTGILDESGINHEVLPV